MPVEWHCVPHRLAAFLLTVAILTAAAWLSPLSAVYTNPVQTIRAQDESFYSSIAINMAQDNAWLAPKFMGRFAFNKPPLGIWLPALSVKIFGPNKMALRLPSILAGGLTALLVFSWLLRVEGLTAAWAAVLFLLGDYWFVAIGKLALTDSLLLAAMTAAYFVLARDPGLEKRGSTFLFGIAVGLAMLTKSVAAFPALATLAIVAPRSRKLPALLFASGVAFVVAAPWHAYQLLVHGNWFWAEYVLDEHLGWGLAVPNRDGQPGNFIFYATTLMKICPWLFWCSLLGFWQRKNLVAGTAAVLTFATMLTFQYQNATYLLGFNVLLAMVAASWFRGWKLVIPAALCLLGLVQQVRVNWPLRENQAIVAVENYCTRERGNELIIVDPDDEFYTTALPLERVRYCYREDSALRRQSPIDFRKMGIILSVSDFLNLKDKLPEFATELRRMGLDSTGPVGTVMAAKSTEEIRQLVQARSEIDFLVRKSFAPTLNPFNHRLIPISESHVLLESQVVEKKHSHACGLLR